jgi:hypothetical protein
LRAYNFPAVSHFIFEGICNARHMPRPAFGIVFHRLPESAADLRNMATSLELFRFAIGDLATGTDVDDLNCYR